MLTFFITIAVNILICTVFYLVVSLKIERSASEFRVKKFRKEMDDVIRDFNETADRNISLLENKIKLLKKMLEKNGLKDNIDFRVDKTQEESQIILNEGKQFPKKANNFKKEDLVYKKENGKKSNSNVIDFTVADKINIDYGEEKKENTYSDEELSDLLKNAKDKHSVISKLYGEGYSAEIISRCSGIPTGEVKLILNLNGQL